MPENPSEPPEAENVRAIRQLVRLMKQYDLSAIDLVEGSMQIRLRRRVGGEAAASPAAPVAAPAPASVVVTPPPPAAPATPPPPPAGATIESPMVGTYYASSAPDAPPFVSIGSQVRADSIVCVIEAMKVFTDIPAGVNGTITEVLVKSGQPVEYGQALFRVNPA
jgi:acetyl-CoA carboxylase biotin carboxyl carrier protein